MRDDLGNEHGGGSGKTPGKKPGNTPGKDIGKTAGFLLMGAAALSFLFPRRRRAPAPEPQTPALQTDSSARDLARPQPARAPRRMWALVQFSPEVIVLAVSPSRAELERELAELNETWNHWELRTERQRYAIQAAPVLYPSQEAAASPIGSAAAG